MTRFRHIEWCLAKLSFLFFSLTNKCTCQDDSVDQYRMLRDKKQNMLSLFGQRLRLTYNCVYFEQKLLVN